MSGGDSLGVLVMAYGGPESLEEVAPYLQDIRGGRPTSAELLEAITERYRRIGGKSPLRGLTERQAAALSAELRLRGTAAKVVVGMRHWQPRIATGVAELAAAGVQRAVGIVMAPHYSRRSIGAYVQLVEQACAATPNAPRFAFVEQFCDRPGFVAAVAEDVGSALNTTDRPGSGPAQARVLFSAHSLPEEWVRDGDPYPEQLRRSAAAVAAAVGLPDSQWRQCFQSAGARPGVWLGPALDSELERAAADQAGDVLVVPFGFVADHVEVLFDIDIEAREAGERLGLTVRRTPSLNDDPRLVAVLADSVTDAAAQL